MYDQVAQLPVVRDGSAEGGVGPAVQYVHT